MHARASGNRTQRKSAWFVTAWLWALLALLLTIAADVQARGRGGGGGGFRGGGIRGGGSTSLGRGGSFGGGSLDRGSSDYRSGGTFSREGNYSRPSALDPKPSALEGSRGSSSRTDWGSMSKVPPGGRTPSQLPADRPGRGGSATQLPADRPGRVGSASQLPANRPDCPKCSDGWDGWVDHPLAAGIAIGAIAGASAAIGTAYYELPPDCAPYNWNEIHYYTCDGVYYEPHYEGEVVVYVTVPDPS